MASRQALTAIELFTIDIPQEELDDLKTASSAPAWPRPAGVGDAYGVPR